MSSAYAASNAGAGAAAAAAAMANAVKAFGSIAKLEPSEFAKILAKSESPLVVTGMGGFFTKKYQYLTSYKGLFFFMESKVPVQLPLRAEIIAAKNIWMPQ
jgi:hypothetical protein